MSATIIDGKAYAAGLRARIAGAVATLRSSGVVPVSLSFSWARIPQARSMCGTRRARRSRPACALSSTACRPTQRGRGAGARRPAQRRSGGRRHPRAAAAAHSRSMRRRSSRRSIPQRTWTGFIPINAGRLMTGVPGFVSCTPLGCLLLIRSVQPDLAGLDAVVIGRSNIVGKPMAQLLLGESCTVTIAHSHARPRRGLPPGRHPGRRGRAARDGARRLDQAGRHRHRCRHQPGARSRRRRGQDAARRRCGICGGRQGRLAPSRPCPVASAR